MDRSIVKYLLDLKWPARSGRSGFLSLTSGVGLELGVDIFELTKVRVSNDVSEWVPELPVESLRQLRWVPRFFAVRKQLAAPDVRDYTVADDTIEVSRSDEM